LRNNHFHSGIDFKTQGVEGKPIHAVQDGYVSRISVSPWGYGNGLYLTHPDGTTTVYGHLQRFAPSIARYIKTQQYEQESFNVNLFLDPDQLPVKKGEIVAYSGNTGSSGGPHLHFEVRDTESEEVLDPIEYFKEKITDTRAPKIQGILVCPQPGKGVVNGSSRKLELKPVTAKNGKQTITGKIEAWGEIGLAVKAYDYMDNTTNIYGVKDITLRQDSQIIYHSNLDRFAFDETRYLNSYVDYEEWKERRSFYMRSFVEPGNRLRFNESINRGIIHIEEEKTYHLTYTLADAFGNTTRLSVWIEGKEQEIPEIETEGTELFHWMADNRFGAKGIRMTIPKGNLYDDLYFRYSVKEDGVDGYTADKTAAKNGETIINTHTPEVIDITVTKNWVDDNNRDGIRPGANDFASKLHLMNGETEVTGVVPSVVDNNDGTYTVKYTNLAKNAAGTPITYSVKEDAVSGYTTDNNTALNGGVITNTHTPERINVVVTKKWDDNNNQDRVRPGADEFASKLHLLADGTEVDGVTAEVVDNNDGTYTVTYSDILKYENGNIIVYGITEDDIAGYSSAQDVVYEGEVLVNVHKVKENNGENGGNKDNTDNNSKNNLNNKSDKKVDTADHSNNMIYYVLIAISATGIISAAAVAGRKKH